MPNDTPPLEITDTDNDDIVDLLEIVKPGNAVPFRSATPEKADDFSADLEAILGQAADAENNPDAAPPTPFPDPTPVDHAVDPDETLSMPSMDDLNNLLASLGADSGPASSAPAPPQEKGAALPDLDALPMAGQRPPAVPGQQDAPNVPLDLDFDLTPPRTAPPAPADGPQRPSAAAPPAVETPPEILLQEPENTPEGEIAQPPALPAIEALFAENTPQPQSLPDMETLFSGQIQDNSAPARPLAETDTSPGTAGLPVQKEPPPQETEEPPSPNHGALRYDGVDLNELDAVLEDMLASAPPPSPHLAREKSTSSPAGDRSGPDLAPLRQAVSRMETGLADLKKELQARDSLIEKQQSSLAGHTALIEELGQSLTSLHETRDSLIEKEQSSLAGQTALIEELRQSLASLHKNRNSLIEKQQSDLAGQTALIEELRQSLASLHEIRDSLIEKQQSSLAGQAALIEELRQSLASLHENRDSLIERQQSDLAGQTALIEELRQSLASLHENMDKMAALSAAKVIREELASILKEEPPAS
jgi:hypothetical protein